MKTLSNPIGYQFTLGWKGAWLCNEEGVAGEQVSIEAVGSDWIVLRTEEGEVLVNTYPPSTYTYVLDMVKELEE